MKSRLLGAENAEQAADILKEAGQTVTAEKAAQLFEKAQARKKDKELSPDELEAVSGGADRDWLKEGCAATVEAGSWCGTNDNCVWIDVQYDHIPVKDSCPQCGGQMYLDRIEVESKAKAYDYCKCLRCGYVQKTRR